MSYTAKINELLATRNMRWSSLPISRSTLDACKRNDVYTTKQLEAIAGAIGVPVTALVGDERPYVLVAELRGHIAEIQRRIDAITAAIDKLQQ